VSESGTGGALAFTFQPYVNIAHGDAPIYQVKGAQSRYHLYR
jgi:hypothetical protein